jgi:hypothetical protein
MSRQISGESKHCHLWYTGSPGTAECVRAERQLRGLILFVWNRCIAVQETTIRVASRHLSCDEGVAGTLCSERAMIEAL